MGGTGHQARLLPRRATAPKWREAAPELFPAPEPPQVKPSPNPSVRFVPIRIRAHRLSAPVIQKGGVSPDGPTSRIGFAFRAMTYAATATTAATAATT